MFIVSSIGAYFIITQLVSIWNRDNMNYQEYNWYFDASSAPAAVSSSDDNPWTITANTCTNVTTSTDTTTSTTESFLPSNAFKY